VLIFILVSGTSGCATFADLLGFGYSQPKVTLRDVEVRGFSGFVLDLVVKLNVQNPNDFDIVLHQLDYNIVVADLQLAQGSYNKRITIKEQAASEVKLPLTVDTAKASAIIDQLIKDSEQELIARITATVVFDSPVGKIEHTFTDDKDINPGK